MENFTHTTASRCIDNLLGKTEKTIDAVMTSDMSDQQVYLLVPDKISFIRDACELIWNYKILEESDPRDAIIESLKDEIAELKADLHFSEKSRRESEVRVEELESELRISKLMRMESEHNAKCDILKARLSEGIFS